MNYTISYLKKQGFWIVGTDMKGTPYDEIDYKGKTAIIIGNEGNGLSDEIARMADTYIHIPMAGKVESLNAAIATSILMYEATR